MINLVYIPTFIVTFSLFSTQAWWIKVFNVVVEQQTDYSLQRSRPRRVKRYCIFVSPLE